MAITELFSTSFLIVLAVGIILCSIIFIYVNYKISQQDHKISSMLGLISTMAQELEFFRNKINNKNAIVDNTSGNNGKYLSNNPGFLLHKDYELINVSDDDEDDSDDDDNSVDDESELSSDEDEDADEEDGDNKNMQSNNIKVLNLNGDLSQNIIDISDNIGYLSNNTDDKGESFSYESDIADSSELEDISVNNTSSIKTIHLEDPIDIKTTILLDTDIHFLKSINANDLEYTENTQQKEEHFDYKKLSIQELRNIANKKGIATDVSKMKKNDIIKLISHA